MVSSSTISNQMDTNQKPSEIPRIPNSSMIAKNAHRTVRLSVSNLSNTVVPSDLKTLFYEFNVKSVAMNETSDDVPIGSALLSLEKRDAEKLIGKYTGVSLDGHIMRFSLIDSDVFSRIEFRGQRRLQKTSKKMTTEELDAELDTYLNCSG